MSNSLSFDQQLRDSSLQMVADHYDGIHCFKNVNRVLQIFEENKIDLNTIKLPKRVREYRVDDYFGKLPGRSYDRVLMEELDLSKPMGWKLKARSRFPFLSEVTEALTFYFPDVKDKNLLVLCAQVIMRLNDRGLAIYAAGLLKILKQNFDQQILCNLHELLPVSIRENPDVARQLAGQSERHGKEILGDFTYVSKLENSQ